MKRRRPLQSGDWFFFASQRLFLNSGFHWLSPLTQTADVTQEKGNGLFFFCFFARQLGFPDFCPVTNRLVWKGGKSQPHTSAGQHRWTEHLPLSSQSQHTEGQYVFFFLSSSPCKNLVSVNKLKTFCRNAKSFFYLAVINIPLGFCLKLHPTDKSRRKSLNL